MNETATSPGVSYVYDNAGNMISSNDGTTITTYSYDFHNRLTEVTQGGTVIASYVYDALNRRIGVDDSGTQTWTVYDGTNPYADFNGSGTLQARYQYGAGVVDGAIVDQLLARTSSGGTTAWYLPDKLGSVRDLVSTSGTELDHVVYDSFGNIVTETNAANGDRFKYAGMEFDASTAQYYDRARWLAPVLGRFLSVDPTGFASHDLNLYRHVGNGPTESTDPTGLQGSSSGDEHGPQNPAGQQSHSGIPGGFEVPKVPPRGQGGSVQRPRPPAPVQGMGSKSLGGHGFPNFEPSDLIDLTDEKLANLESNFQKEFDRQSKIAKEGFERSRDLAKKWEIEIGEKIKASLAFIAHLRMKAAAEVLKDVSAREAIEAFDKAIQANEAAMAASKALTAILGEKSRRDLIPTPPTRSPSNSRSDQENR